MTSLKETLEKGAKPTPFGGEWSDGVSAGYEGALDDVAKAVRAFRETLTSGEIDEVGEFEDTYIKLSQVLDRIDKIFGNFDESKKKKTFARASIEKEVGQADKGNYTHDLEESK